MWLEKGQFCLMNYILYVTLNEKQHWIWHVIYRNVFKVFVIRKLNIYLFSLVEKLCFIYLIQVYEYNYDVGLL